jgi:hypothetical protein
LEAFAKYAVALVLARSNDDDDDDDADDENEAPFAKLGVCRMMVRNHDTTKRRSIGDPFST